MDEFDLITYLRPSRYCESDTLAPTAASQFAGLADQELLRRSRLGRRPAQLRAGSSLPTDGAVRPCSRPGVRRGLRPPLHRAAPRLKHPARMAAVFAPGLSPMEYHAGLRGVHSG